MADHRMACHGRVARHAYNGGHSLCLGILSQAQSKSWATSFESKVLNVSKKLDNSFNTYKCTFKVLQLITGILIKAVGLGQLRGEARNLPPKRSVLGVCHGGWAI